MRPIAPDDMACLEKLAHDGLVADASPQGLEALLEAMFLMAIADGDVSEEEVRQFARACSGLVDDVGEADVEGMFMQWSHAAAEEGWERRVRAIADAVVGTELAEVAFRLAVAIAVVDHNIVEGEADALDVMAHALGIDPERSHQLVDEVYRSMRG